VRPDGRILSRDGKAGDTQSCYLLALRFDLLPEAMRPLAVQHLVNDIVEKRKGHLSTGFVGVSYLNPTLTQVGHTDLAYRLLLNKTFPSWGYSIQQGATTIWERWDGWTVEKGFQDPGMNSFNHYALGSVGEWLYDTVAGIDLEPERPGYKHIALRPRPGGGLTSAKAAYDSLYGKIVSEWKYAGGRWVWKVTVPPNTTATVFVPTTVAVQEGDGPAERAEGVRFLRREPNATVYEVGSGHYLFSFATN
jgi:alpha-L-rhamnosidase